MTRSRVRSYGLYLILPFIFSFVSTMAFLGLSYPQASHAADLNRFDPGYIISDYQMGNYDSMSVNDIQAFLSAHGNCYDTATWKASDGANNPSWFHVRDGHFVCLAEETFGEGVNYGDGVSNGKSAAQIIYNVAHEYRINPQVLIVLLEKEQGLISDSWPNIFQYRIATGYGCPDTGEGCDNQYYGFENQLSWAAHLFRTVLDGGWTNFPLGDNYIGYNPDPGCGGSVVNVRNLATSALYRYTPYQPNAGALAAGYGAGIPCGAYGNRNFYLLFNDWFGDSTISKQLPSLEEIRAAMEKISPEPNDLDISYSTHHERFGWLDPVKGGEVSGLTGQSLRLESIKLNINDSTQAGDISYRTHVENIGWQDWVKNGETSGTTGQSLRIEAIEIRLSEELEKMYDVYYRTHVQNIGWQDWVKNGETSGTTGQSLRIEAIQIKIVAKELPELDISYRAHVQNIGWQDWKNSGEMAGTTGESLRMEAIEIITPEDIPVDAISYHAHVQNIGWQDWVDAGELAGTTGESLRMEAIEIKLSEEYGEIYKLQYRAHVENIGWQDWVNAGELAGTTGESLRMEAIEVRLTQN